MTRFSWGVLYAAAALVTGIIVAGDFKTTFRRHRPTRPPRTPEPRPPLAPPTARYTPEGATIH